jgi:hypothetical protein
VSKGIFWGEKIKKKKEKMKLFPCWRNFRDQQKNMKEIKNEQAQTNSALVFLFVVWSIGSLSARGPDLQTVGWTSFLSPSLSCV